MHTQETLRRVEQNDPTLKQLCIGDSDVEGGFAVTSAVSSFSRLGECIVDNTHIERLYFIILSAFPVQPRPLLKVDSSRV